MSEVWKERKISVIVPVYNVQDYIYRCMDSVVGQTYTNLEIICVDDGSADNSGRICDEFARRDSRIKVIHQENQGIAEARNKGVSLSTGYYLAFVDGDDWIEPDMYEKMAALMERYGNLSSVVCNYFMDESDAVLNRKNVPETPVPNRKFLYYIYNRDVYKGVSSYLWNRLFISGSFKRISPFRAGIGEDVLAAAEFYLGEGLSVYTKEPLYHYCRRESSITHDMRRRLDTMEMCRVYEEVIQRFISQGAETRTILLAKRFYVYHCAVLLDFALKRKDTGRAEILKAKIKSQLGVYAITNWRHPSRIAWVCGLLRG